MAFLALVVPSARLGILAFLMWAALEHLIVPVDILPSSKNTAVSRGAQFCKKTCDLASFQLCQNFLLRSN